jgi:hypothetical protein
MKVKKKIAAKDPKPIARILLWSEAVLVGR